MLKRVLAYAAVCLLAGGVAVWAVDAPASAEAAGKAAAAEAKTGETAKGDSKAVAEPKNWIETNLDTVETQMAYLEKQVGAAVDEDVKATGNELLSLSRDMVDLLHQAQGAMTTGGRKAALKYQSKVEELRKARIVLQEKLDLVMQNARLKAQAAQANAGADVKALIDVVVKANLEIIDLKAQLAKKLADKEQVMRQIDQERTKGRQIGPTRRVTVTNPAPPPAKTQETAPATVTPPATTGAAPATTDTVPATKDETTK